MIACKTIGKHYLSRVSTFEEKTEKCLGVGEVDGFKDRVCE